MEVRGHLELRTTFRRCCLPHREHQVPRLERPLSLQHTVGQTRTEQAEGSSIDEAYEDEVA